MDVKPAIAPGTAPANQVASRPERSETSSSIAHQAPARQFGSSPAAPSNGGDRLTEGSPGPAGVNEDRRQAEQLKAFISDKNVDLRTYHDEGSGRRVLEVTDQRTGDVVGQYPSEELLRLYAALREPLVDQSA